MHVVGIEANRDDDAAVHTIDIWYSDRQRAWMVERLNAVGHHIGVSLTCESRADAMACAAEWLRTHPETCFISPEPDPAPRAARRPALRQATARDLRHEESSLTARA